MSTHREIERKFLVADETWRSDLPGVPFRQGYLSTAAERTVRVRLEGTTGKITLKGLKRGATAPEYEYEIPASDVESILTELCIEPVITKMRHTVRHTDGHEWTIDEFGGANEGLVLAEIELDSEDETFEKPGWLGAEVTRDFRYSNAKLAERPYGTWSDDEKKTVR
jgi:adenylate cyclase